MSVEPIRYYDRYARTVKTEQVFGEKWLRFAYENPAGRFFVWLAPRREPHEEAPRGILVGEAQPLLPEHLLGLHRARVAVVVTDGFDGHETLDRPRRARSSTPNLRRA